MYLENNDLCATVKNEQYDYANNYLTQKLQSVVVS